MARFAICAWYSRDDYDTIRTLCHDDSDLPKTFDEWLQFATKQVADLEASGRVVKKQIVDSKEFAEWCRAGGVEPNRYTRDQFSVQKAYERER